MVVVSEPEPADEKAKLELGLPSVEVETAKQLRLVQSAAELYSSGRIKQSSITNSDIQQPHFWPGPKAAGSVRPARRVAVIGKELRRLTAAELKQVRTATSIHMHQQSGATPSRLLRTTNQQIERLQGALLQLDSSRGTPIAPSSGSSKILQAITEAKDATGALAELLPKMGVHLPGLETGSASANEGRSFSLHMQQAASCSTPSLQQPRVSTSSSMGEYPMPVRGLGLPSQMLGAEPRSPSCAASLYPITPPMRMPTVQANTAEVLYDKMASLPSQSSRPQSVLSQPPSIRNATTPDGGLGLGTSMRPDAGVSSPSWVLELLSTATAEAQLINLVLGPFARGVQDDTMLRGALTHIHLMLCCDGSGRGDMVLAGQGEAQWLPPVPLQASTIMTHAFSTQRKISCTVACKDPKFSAELESPYYNDHSILMLPLLPPASVMTDTDGSTGLAGAPLGLLILGGTPRMLSDVPAAFVDHLQTATSIIALTLERLRAASDLSRLLLEQRMQRAVLSSRQEQKAHSTSSADSLCLAIRSVDLPTAASILHDGGPPSRAGGPPVSTTGTLSLAAAQAVKSGDAFLALGLTWAEHVLPVLAAAFNSASALFLRYEPDRTMLCAGDDPTSSFAVRLPLPGSPSVLPGTAAAKQIAAGSPELSPALQAACTLGAAFSPDGVASPLLSRTGELIGVWHLSGRVKVRIGPVDPSTTPSLPYTKHDALRLRAAANALNERISDELSRAETTQSPLHDLGGPRAKQADVERLLRALISLNDSTYDGGSALAVTISAFCAGVLRCSHASLLRIIPEKHPSRHDHETGVWGWDGLGRRVLVQCAPNTGLATAATKAGEALLGPLSDAFAAAVGPRLKGKDVEAVLAIPVTGSGSVIQLTRLQAHKVGLSPPAQNAFAAASAVANATIASTNAARSEFLGNVLQQKDQPLSPDADRSDGPAPSPPRKAPPPPLPPPPPPRVSVAVCQATIEGITNALRTTLQRMRSSVPKAHEQLQSLQRALAFQLCVARRGAAASAVEAGAPTDDDAGQAGLASLCAAAARLMRGLLSSYGCRLLLQTPNVFNGDSLHTSYRGAVVAREKGFDDAVIAEKFVKRDVAPTQRGVAIAAAFYRKPQNWSVGGGLGKSAAEGDALLDGVPGESSSSMKSVLALPLLVGGNDLVGMLVFTNKIPAFTGIRQRTPHTPMQKRVHGAPATAEELMAQMPTVHASFVAERSDSAVPGFEEPRWFQAGLREAGWLEEPKDFGTGFSSRRLRAARTEEIADFAELDVELASSLIPDVTLAVAHAQLESSAAAARQTLDSPSKQNELRVNVGRVLSCAPDAALLARRACRTAALVLRAEHALLFRFEQPSLTLWRCASSSRAELPPCSVVVDPSFPRSVAGVVALTGKSHSSHSPHADPALLPGLDAPEGMRLDNLLAVPLFMGDAGNSAVMGVLMVLNRHASGANSSACDPLAREAAREHAAVLVGDEAHTDGSGAHLAMWELAVLTMISEETGAALSELAYEQREDDAEDEAAPPARSPLLDALCAAERRLVEAEDKVALMRAAQLTQPSD